MQQVTENNSAYYRRITNVQFWCAAAFLFMMPLLGRNVVLLLELWVLLWLLPGRFRARFAANRGWNGWIWPALYYLVVAAGILWSENTGSAWFDLEVKMMLLIAPLLLRGCDFIYIRRRNLLLLVFVAGNLMAGIFLLGLALYHSLHYNGVQWEFNPVSNTYWKTSYFFYSDFSAILHPSYYAMYLAFSMAILFYFMNVPWLRRRWLQQGLIAACIVFILILLYLLSSKAGIIAGFLTLICGLYAGIISRLPWRWRAGVVAVVTLAFALVFLLNQRFATTRSSLHALIRGDHSTLMPGNESESLNDRLTVWPVAFGVGCGHFWTGAGTGDGKDMMMEKYKALGMKRALEHQHNAHNQYLETFAAQGIMGVLALLAMFLIPLLAALRYREFLPMMFLGIVMVNFLFESMLNTQAGVLFIGFFYGWLGMAFLKPRSKQAST